MLQFRGRRFGNGTHCTPRSLEAEAVLDTNKRRRALRFFCVFLELYCMNVLYWCQPAVIRALKVPDTSRRCSTVDQIRSHTNPNALKPL
jgi:hypothetical protein